MYDMVTSIKNLERSRAEDHMSFCVGQLVRITEHGCAVVDYPGNPRGPIEARSAVAEPTKDYSNREKGLRVLLVFENGDPALPIVVGILHDTLYPTRKSEEIAFPLERPRDCVIDGKKIILDAKQEIVLRCGKSSVILRKDGKVVVKGIYITSRASKANKIKGASVNIN